MNIVVMERGMRCFEDVRNGIILIKGITDRVGEGRVGEEMFGGRYLVEFVE